MNKYLIVIYLLKTCTIITITQNPVSNKPRETSYDAPEKFPRAGLKNS